jgi:hypothetical protein
MDVMLLVQQFHVPGVGEVPAGLERLDLGEGRLVHPRHQHLLGVGVVGRDAGHHVGNDQPAQMPLVAERVLDRQDPAPGLPVQDEAVPVQAQRAPDLLHLVDESVQIPQRRIVGLIAEARAKLVVVVVLHASAGQVAVAGLQVLVRRSWPAVQQQEPQARIVAHPLDPHPVPAGGRVDRDQPRAAAQRVIPAGRIQITAHRRHSSRSPLGGVPRSGTVKKRVNPAVRRHQPRGRLCAHSALARGASRRLDDPAVAGALPPPCGCGCPASPVLPRRDCPWCAPRRRAGRRIGRI